MDFTSLLHAALKKAGKQETLAIELDLAPSVLSRRLNGENGWQEREINRLLAYVGCGIVDRESNKKKIEILKETLKIVLEED